MAAAVRQLGLLRAGRLQLMAAWRQRRASLLLTAAVRLPQPVRRQRLVLVWRQQRLALLPPVRCQQGLLRRAEPWLALSSLVRS
jgi:hypothetical protein